MKVKRIQIKSANQGLEEFVKTYKKVARGKPLKKKGGTYFASIAAARKILTEERIRLLKTIKNEKPTSIYELAKLTQRNFKNVSQDIGFLSELGLVELEKTRGVRSQRKPTLVSDHIYVELSI